MKVSDILRESTRNNSILNITQGILTLDINLKTKQEDFAKILKQYQMRHQKISGKRNLLFVIDGLDEI